jgi:NhaP-type Na+/H+ or K+/H+ antiporter
VAGGVSAGQVALGLLVAVAGGTALGFVGGRLARRALGLLDDPAAETTVTIAVPFALYLVADRIGSSGVLAVLVAGLYLRSSASREVTSAGWLLGRSVWRYVDFAVSGLLFAFLGVELTNVLATTSLLGDGSTLRLAAAVLGVLVVSRAAAMFLASGLAGRRARRAGSATPYGWRESAVAAWAGMRGVVTVATALALPQAGAHGDFPAREEVVLVALLVVIATLVLQGLTLAPLIRRLRVASEVDERSDVRRLHRLATEAALDRLRDVDDVPEEVRAVVLQQYESRLGYRNSVLVPAGSCAACWPAPPRPNARRCWRRDAAATSAPEPPTTCCSTWRPGRCATAPDRRQGQSSGAPTSMPSAAVPRNSQAT